MLAAAPAAKVDVLFVVDDSGGMEDEQRNLARNAEAWIDALAATRADYRIAVVTTDVVANGGESGFERAGFETLTHKSTFPFVLTGFDASECTNTTIPHGCFRGPVIRSAEPRDAQIRAFGEVILVGTCGSGNEMALKGMSLALRAPCNAGFFRDDAELLVVIISNAEDWEIEGAPHGAVETPLSTYVAELVRKKGGAGKIRVAAIVAWMDGRPSRCGVGPDGAPAPCGSLCDARGMIRDGSGMSCRPGAQNTCPAGEYCLGGANRCENQDLQYWDSCWHCSMYNAPDCCAARPARYADFALEMEAEIAAARPDLVKTGCRPPAQPEQRGACLIESICQAEYRDTLIRIAALAGGPASTYPLDPPASDPAGVAVVIGGTALTKGEDFTVSADGRTLTLSDSARPAPGTPIDVYCLRELPP